MDNIEETTILTVDEDASINDNFDMLADMFRIYNDGLDEQLLAKDDSWDEGHARGVVTSTAQCIKIVLDGLYINRNKLKRSK